MSSSTRVVVIVPAGRCELCGGAELCPQCDGYGTLAGPVGRSGEPCPLCTGGAGCPWCVGVGAVDAVLS